MSNTQFAIRHNNDTCISIGQTSYNVPCNQMGQGFQCINDSLGNANLCKVPDSAQPYNIIARFRDSETEEEYGSESLEFFGTRPTDR